MDKGPLWLTIAQRSRLNLAKVKVHFDFNTNIFFNNVLPHVDNVRQVNTHPRIQLASLSSFATSIAHHPQISFILKSIIWIKEEISLS